MSRNPVKRKLSPGSAAIKRRRETALKNIEKHLKKEKHDESSVEKHNKEAEILKERLA